MGIGKIIFLVLFFLVSIPLIIITLISAKDDGASSTIMGETVGAESGYGRKKSKEDKMDLVIRILFGLFIVIVIGGYFI